MLNTQGSTLNTRRANRYDAVTAVADVLAVFPIGPIDYGLAAVDAAAQQVHLQSQTDKIRLPPTR